MIGRDAVNGVLRVGLRPGIDPSRGYPRTAAEVQRIIGGNWGTGVGYLFNETSGDPAAVFGSPATLSTVNTPTQGARGPRGGADRAIGFDSADDKYSAGNVFNVGAGDDLIVAGIARFASAQSGTALITKRSATGWLLLSASSGQYQFNAFDGSDFNALTGANGQHAGEWHAFIAAASRGSTSMCIGTRSLRGVSVIGSSTSIAALGATTDATANLFIGGTSFGTTPIGWEVAALYLVAGAGVAAGVPAGLPTALQNLTAAVMP